MYLVVAFDIYDDLWDKIAGYLEEEDFMCFVLVCKRFKRISYISRQSNAKRLELRRHSKELNDLLATLPAHELQEDGLQVALHIIL